MCAKSGFGPPNRRAYGCAGGDGDGGGAGGAGGSPKFGVRKISLPLSVRTMLARSVRLMYGAPGFTRRPMSVIRVPILTVAGVQPNCFANCCRPPISAVHLVVLP